MSRYFVTDQPVPIAEFDASQVISDVPPNVIYIRARMDVETKGKVASELVTVGRDGTPIVHAGANETALLIHNIVRWEGPDLGGVACTPENIRKLDPTDPHIARVLEEIAARNKTQPSPKGASPAPNGSTNAGSTGLNTHSSVPEHPLASMTSRSPLQNAITGFQKKLES